MIIGLKKSALANFSIGAIHHEVVKGKDRIELKEICTATLQNAIEQSKDKG